MTRLARLALLAFVMVSCIGCDQATKHLAARELAGQPSVMLLGGSLHLTYAENAGGFLSLGADLPEPLRSTFFVAFSSALVLGLLAFAIVGRSLTAIQVIAMGLLAAGGIGNLWDRVTRGSTRDFIVLRMGSLSTGVFNLADFVIMVGVAVLLVSALRPRRAAPERA